MIRKSQSISTIKLYVTMLFLCLGFVIASKSFAQPVAVIPFGQIPNEDLIMLKESRPYVATADAWQTFNDYIRLKPGQDKRKLLLIFTNGADGRAKLTDLQISLARKPLAKLQDFNAAGILTCDLSGKLAVGRNLVTVQVFGPSGARLTWKLCTAKVTVTSVTPNPFTLANTLTVQGANFSDNIHNTKVSIGGKAVQVIDSKPTTLQLQPSAGLHGGEQDMVVSADSIASAPFKVTVMIAPQVKSLNLFCAPPGYQVVINGRNFAPSGNVVTFGNVQAQVVNANAYSITCIVPSMDFPRYHVPVKVTTNGMQSKERVFFNLDIRIIPN